MSSCGFFFISVFFPVAKSCESNQSRKFSLLSQLALSSQNKFFLKLPPKYARRAGQAPGSPDADLVAELDLETDSSESLSPTGQYENCPSAGLDCAISDLVSLDSQAEVEQGIVLREGTTKNHNEAAGLFFVLLCTVSQSRHSTLFFKKESFPPLYLNCLKFDHLHG